MKKSTILAGLFFTTAAATAYAHGGATGIVKERMDAMSAMGKAVKALAPMMRGETTYDPAAVRSTAKVIGSHAGTNLTKLFPEGSGGAPSESKGAIWVSWNEFSKLAERLEIYADGLASAADNGLMSANQAGASAATMMGSGSMMGAGSGMMGGTMMQAAMSAEDIAAMPVDGAFEMVSQVCSACHTKFRAESK